ncbi:GNAT family N-acetyltransferase [Dactylosporangium sp. CA-092794]|uniref:GNAT family N-acetyltransferase n=1 Tax=Dactylosporangium sp. CA-092794 TaxID=3239929 RepID=UPI003D89DE9C
MDVHARAYRPGDAAAIAGLINAIAEAGGGPGGFAAADVEGVVEHEIRDPAADTRLLTDAGGALVGAALVPLPPAGGDRLELIGGVRPDRRGAGLGRELLAWQLGRAAARHAEIAPEARWQAQVVTGAADAAATRLYERFGFAVARYFLEMTAPTTPAPVVTPAGGIRLAPYQQDQERRVYSAHTAAFRGLWGYQERDFGSWAALTVRSGTFRPELSRLALAGDTIAGYLLAYDSGEPDRVYIGQVGTAGPWRRRGVASALLAEALAAAGRAGYVRAGLDTDAANPTGAAGVYARAGFVVDRRVVAYRRPVTPAAAPAAAR